MSLIHHPKLRLGAALLVLGSVGGALAWRVQAQSRVPSATAPSRSRAAAAADAQARDEMSGSAAEAPTADASAHPASTTALWKAPGPVTGVKVDPDAPLDPAVSASERARRGRSAVLDSLSVAAVEELQPGQQVSLPLLNGEVVTGRVNLVQPDASGWVRVGGELRGDRKGSFALNTDGRVLSGTVQLPAEKLAYEVEPQPDGRLVLREKRLADVVCFPLPREPRRPKTATATPSSPSAAAAAVPLLSSRPSASAVLYLDFDGETVTDPAWNGGATINAQPAPFTAAETTEIWNRVKEDYAPFNLDVTTDASRYAGAAVGRRMRVIVTPTDTAAPGSGGVAYLYSFARAGTRSFSSTVPAWVFNLSVDGAAEAIAHEAGHTFGLSHDGRTSPVEEYFRGQGTGATSWGPIMGAAYGVAITQWSKGEYAYANNQEDDVAIIGGSANGFGFVADEAGDAFSNAAALSVSAGAISQPGVITQASDADCFVFSTGGGALALTASPAAVRPNLDLLLQLYDGAGNIVMQSNPDQTFDASLTVNVTAGTYYARVLGAGHGNPQTDGYSSYGSLGVYTLTGSVPAEAPAPNPPPPTTTDLQPSITSPTYATGTVGSAFSYQITATNGVYQYDVTGTLPPGLSIDRSTGVISGVPSEAGWWTVGIWAANSTLVDHKDLTISTWWP